MDRSRLGYYWNHLECRWEKCPSRTDAAEIPTQPTSVETGPEADVPSQ